jgi:outer membrane lipoprotein SlyB
MFSIGPGLTNKGMVVVGAAGGAAYAQKPNAYQRQRWDVTIKMDSGPPPRVVNLAYEPFFQEGDRVRVSGTQLELVNP